jgi:DNA-binding MarR family transcriptional regulator
MGSAPGIPVGSPPLDLALESEAATEATLAWLEHTLPHILRRLLDSENLDMPLLQLPLAQMRLAQALYKEAIHPDILAMGETMGHLSERLGVRQNALTQAADRLINHGLAERTGDPQDRRIVRLRLTAQGQEWVQARRARRRAHLQQFWSTLDSQDREALLRAVGTLETLSARLSESSEEAASRLELKRASDSLLTLEEALARETANTAKEAFAEDSGAKWRQIPAQATPTEIETTPGNVVEKGGI